MKLCISLVATLFISTSHAFLSFQVTEAERNMIFYNYLTDTCNCVDRFIWCPFLTKRCSERLIETMCLLSCKKCKECDSPVVPTLYPTVQTCEFNCGNLWPLAICEYYEDRRVCPFIRGYCRQECGECKPCVLPPNSPPPCRPGCANNLPTRDCEFWNRRGFCDSGSVYPSVRFNCQETCGICRQCA